jgi:hypothetical protein
MNNETLTAFVSLYNLALTGKYEHVPAESEAMMGLLAQCKALIEQEVKNAQNTYLPPETGEETDADESE